jgi:adenylate cyclase 10
MYSVQRAIYKYEGSLNKFLVDDKGSTLLAVLGLPPLAHEDDPERAVLMALALADELHKQHMNCYIGVTSGIAFCGPVGSGSRREYSVLGDVVNTSARLMQMASSMQLQRDDVFRGCILTDKATKKSAESNPSIVFQAPVSVQLRGKVTAMEVFQPGLLKVPSSLSLAAWGMWDCHTRCSRS